MTSAQPQQLNLFGSEPPALDSGFSTLRRIDLGEGAWLEYAQGWLRGHERLLQTLAANVRWRSERREMYERVVDVPRLYAVLPDDGIIPPVLEQVRRNLASRYREPFPHLSLGYYRDGRDSVAWHGDYVAREMDVAVMATISVGAPRRFLLRPYGGGSSCALSLGWGDLLVMCGTCQRTFQHSVPKVKHALPRIAIMFRPDWGSADQPEAYGKQPVGAQR